MQQLEEHLSLETFRQLMSRAGLSLSEEELTQLRGMAEHHLALAQRLRQRELSGQEPAISFRPDRPLKREEG